MLPEKMIGSESHLTVREDAKTCMKLETTTLIFAIFNLTISSAAVLASAGTMVYFFVCLIKQSTDTFNDFLLWYHCSIMVLVTAASCIALVFAVYLVKGIYKKNAFHLRAYFTYGVVTCVLSAAGAISWCIFSELEDYIVTNVILIMCFAYSLVLYMIYKTYTKFESDRVYQYGPKLLVEP